MTIAFDFDGVIHKYSKGWQDGSIYDEISKDWFSLVRELLEKGHSIFILTTRPKKQIYKYFKENYYGRTPEQEGLPCGNIWTEGFAFRIMPFWERFFKSQKTFEGYSTVGICNHKAVFDILIDDRAICFEGSFEKMVDKIDTFLPWVDREDAI